MIIEIQYNIEVYKKSTKYIFCEPVITEIVKTSRATNRKETGFKFIILSGRGGFVNVHHNVNICVLVLLTYYVVHFICHKWSLVKRALHFILSKIHKIKLSNGSQYFCCIDESINFQNILLF